MRIRLAAFATLVLLAACHGHGEARDESGGGGAIIGEGGHITRDFALSGFDRINVQGPDDVTVQIGGTTAIHAEGDASAVNKLKIEVVDGELRIGRTEGYSTGEAKISVTLPAIKAVALTGSGDMRVDRASGDHFKAMLGGSGNLDIGQLSAKEASFALSGSGDATLIGKADKASFAVTGSGDVNGGGLQTVTADISAQGSGNVELRASSAARISIMGSGDVKVRGTTNCAVNKMGSGDADCAV
jgi:hypothetical protein